MKAIIVPGWQDSEPEHWQTHWHRELGCERVIQDDWWHPVRAHWLKRLEEAIYSQPESPILITHSLGSNTAAILSAESDCAVRGVFMVSPADLSLTSTPSEILNFRPVPMQKLRFPSVLVASEDDPFCEIATARAFAQAWGSQFVSVGCKGHINVSAGCGPWPEGRSLLADFIRSLA